MASRIEPERVVGRAPESLSIEETRALAGHWIALEIYTPKALPLRRIEAIGDSAAACAARLAARGLDPRRFEFILLRPSV